MQRKHSNYDIFLFCQQFFWFTCTGNSFLFLKKSYKQVNQNIYILYERERQTDNANLKKFLCNKILIFLCCHKQSLLECIYPRRHHGIGHPKVYIIYTKVWPSEASLQWTVENHFCCLLLWLDY